MTSNEELQLDIEELNRLLLTAERSRTKGLLTKEIKQCEQMMAQGSQQTQQHIATEPTDTNVLQSVTTVVPQKYYRDITNYAWDQSDKFMKIYVSLSGIEGAAAIAKDNIKTEFTDKSFRLRLENVSDKNYQCHVGFLWAKIIPADSYHKLKSDSILLMLKKAEEKKTWAFVTEREGKEDKKKKSKLNTDTKEKDPNDGLMSLLKQMYDDGDDEMKRTIAKSWSESRNKTSDLGGL
jgi:calcyclin binding protein